MLPERQHLLRSLDQATARLASLHPGNVEQVQQALAERSLAIDAISAWIAAAGEALRPDSLELANHLVGDLERGAEILVRLALDREATRLDLARLDRERHLLQRLSGPGDTKPCMIDQQG